MLGVYLRYFGWPNNGPTIMGREMLIISWSFSESLVVSKKLREIIRFYRFTAPTHPSIKEAAFGRPPLWIPLWMGAWGL